VTADEDRLELAQDDFRRGRSMLAPSAFAFSEGEDPPISDLVRKDVWDHLVHLPDDVAIRTTNWFGSKVVHAHEVSSQWLFATPISPVGEPFAPEPSILASEEFDALQFNALHGYYRQALGCLRNALETMTHAAALAATGREAEFRQWRAGDLELRFGVSREAIQGSEVGQRITRRLGGGPVFGDLRSGGWIAILYRRLCAYAHSQAGYNNADFWESNGPVYVPRTYVLILDELRETIAVCYVLLRICWPEFNPPGNLSLLLDEPALNNWPETARRVMDASFGA
jgi:hypothetical protein